MRALKIEAPRRRGELAIRFQSLFIGVELSYHGRSELCTRALYVPMLLGGILTVPIMKVPNIRELGELYPKTAVLGITALIVAGGVFILGTGVGFDFSRFFACDPAEGECPGGGFNSGEDISFEVTEDTDVTESINQGGTNEEEAVVAEEATGGASGEVLGSSTEDSCADGDCDGDGYLNPVVGGNDCDDDNANVHPGAGCAGAVAQVATAAPSPTVVAAITNNPNPTTAVDPCADGDCDGDGYLNPVVQGGNDCDDSNPAVHPGAGCSTPTPASTPTPTPIPGEPTPAPTQTPATTPTPALSPTVSPGVLGKVDEPCLDNDCDNDGAIRPSQVDVSDGSDCNDLSAAVTTLNFDCDGDGVFNLQKPGIAITSADCNDFDSSIKTECRSLVSAPVIAQFRSGSSNVARGSVAQLSWDVRGASSCVGTGFSTGGALSGSVATDPLQSTTSFTLSCSNASGATAKTIEVVVDAPATHLACVQNSCSVVAGSGTNECDSSGASCGGGSSSEATGGASHSDLVNWFRSQGVQVEGQFTAACLETVKKWIGRMGSKGNLKKMNNTVGSGALAQMSSDGTMGLRSEECGDHIVAHELAHALMRGNGGLTSAAESMYRQSGGRSITKGSSASSNAHEMTAYGVGWFAGGFRSNLIEGARELGLIPQYNFIAGFPGVNEEPIARSPSRDSSLASIARMLEEEHVEPRVFGVDASLPPEYGIDDFHIAGPSAVILSHQNGQTVTQVPVLVSGETLYDYATKAETTKIRVEINRVFATDVTPSIGSCVGGVTQCKPWSVSLNLRSGSSEIRVVATDANGVDGAPSVVMLNVPEGSGVAISGATSLSLIQDPIFTAGSGQQSSTLQGVASRVATGPGEVTLAALLLSALVSLLYTGYTRTGLYRRSEVERIVERERAAGGDMNFSKPEDK